MIIDQVDAFKSWLTAVLRPMCEADPAALAKYVLALIKKDKSEEELRKSMVGQLDVFLEGETESFVDLVFQTLNTKEYINMPVIPNTNPPNPIVVKPTKEPTKESKIIVQPSELPNLNETMNGAAKKELEPRRDRDSRKNSDADRDERPLRRRSPRHRSLSRNRTRSRSRSWDRSKRSRSREKSREREQHRLDREKRDRNRPWRNKSPLRRYERRRSRTSRTPSPARLRSRSRSPRHSHRNRYRNRATVSRSRSRSPEKRDRRDSAKEKEKDTSRPGTPTQDSNHGDMDLRLTNSTQSIQSVVVQQGGKKRCRDFDEKGYCMRGEMCPFDHGIDPVVLEDAALTRVLSYNPNGTPVVVSSLPAPVLTAPGHPILGQRHPAPQDNPYNPQAPQIWRDARFRGPRPPGVQRIPPLGVFPPQANMNRELIPVPVMDQKQPEGYTPVYNQPPGFLNAMDHDNNPYKKKAFDFNRLGPRAKNPQNCSLELKKVPQGMNSITHLNNHFSKFGKIVNIQVQFEGDPEAAIVTFSSHAEANAAYRSTEAVLNNRFIKVFWHNPSAGADGKQENVPPPPRSVKERLGSQAGAVAVSNANKVLNLVQPRADVSNGSSAADGQDGDSETGKAKENKEETKAQATAAIKKNQELLAAQAKVTKNKDVQRKEVMKIQNDLRKRKQELLEKQLSQQKVLIEKMEKLPAGPQRDVIKETIKKTQEAIEAIKKDIEAATLLAKNAPAKKTKEEAQRELLDTELDLITKQQEGADTSEIQKKLIELKARVACSARGRGRGARRYMPSRHLLTKNNLVDSTKLKGVTKPLNRTPSTTALQTAASFQKHIVDHRPTRLLVSGYETDEQDSVLSHFQQYGEVVDYVVDSSLPSITLNYKTRKEAEMALLKGKNFQDRTLSITWSNKQLSRQRSGGSSARTVLMSETEEEQLIDQSLLEGDEELGPEISEEALLQDDEEEEDEDRSWRR